MTNRLGLGTRLLDSPDDAKSPEVAIRILVAWLVDPQRGIATARKAIAGSSTSQLDRFAQVYHKLLADL